MKLLGFIVVLDLVAYELVSSIDIPSCDSPVYCKGRLLDVVQRARIFNDSKTFVNQRMKFDQNTVLFNFEELMNSTENNPSRNDTKNFVHSNFEDGDELEPWDLPDFNENPAFLQRVSNESFRNFAKDIVNIWPTLARKIKPCVLENIERYSIIPVPNGFIIPGGRFEETYYWDSFWIIKGLLISEMPKTAQSMIENLIYFVEQFGFIPNGGRIYYLNRSQPPLLTGMVRMLVDNTFNLTWLAEHISTLERELEFFLVNRTVDVVVENDIYQLAHYDSESYSPRPESYGEDVDTCSSLNNENLIKNCYADLKTAAESGWDFSYRWVFDAFGGNNANRTSMSTRRVIPVELNAILAKSFKDLACFFKLLGNLKKSNYWTLKFLEWKLAIHAVLYDVEMGVWFDYDIKLKEKRKYFYPTNISPLWAEIYEHETAQVLARNASEYLLNEGILNYYGGTPSSLNDTGEQWDYPNAWAPLQSMIIQGLQKSGNDKAQDLARTLASRWIESNLIGYEQTGEIFEKYDAEHPGQVGGGGEYTVQTGFGWTNGIILETIVDFFTE